MVKEEVALPSVRREEGDAAVINGVLDVTTKRFGFNECVRQSPRAVNSRSAGLFTGCNYSHAKSRTERRHWAGKGMRRLASRDARLSTAMMNVEKLPMVWSRRPKHGCPCAVYHARSFACPFSPQTWSPACATKGVLLHTYGKLHR
jgi:hypothetical protein